MKRRRGKRNEADMTTAVEALLERAPDPVCSAAVREALEKRVMAGLQTDEPAGRGALRRQSDDRAVGLGKLPRTAIIKRAVLVPALALVLIAVMTAGAYALSAGANPDSALYGVKLFFERARFDMTGSDLARAELSLEYAEKRMTELESMVSRGTNDGSLEWLEEYEENLRETKEYSARLQGDVAIDVQARLGQLAETHLQLLQSLSVQATFDLSPAIVEALDVCSIVGASSQNPLTPADSGSTGSPPAAPGAPGASSNSSVATPPGEVYTSPVETREYSEVTPPPSSEVPGDGNYLHPSEPYNMPDWPWPSFDWWNHVELNQGSGSGGGN